MVNKQKKKAKAKNESFSSHVFNQKLMDTIIEKSKKTLSKKYHESRKLTKYEKINYRGKNVRQKDKQRSTNEWRQELKTTRLKNERKTNKAIEITYFKMTRTVEK